MPYGTERIKPGDRGIPAFIEAIEQGDYQIPTFQRDVAWKEENVKKLWDSIYRYYPIGSLLLWKTNTPLEFHRRIGGHRLQIRQTADTEKGKRQYNYLLDGQQRATAIFLSLKGEVGDIAGRAQFDPTLYVDLSFEEQEDDEHPYRSLFLYWNEIDDKGGKLKQNTKRKQLFDQGLIVKLNDTYARIDKIEEHLIELGYSDYNCAPRTNLRQFDSILKNYRISFIELAGIEVSEVCDIFERVNREGRPLDVVDIIVAKTYRQASAESPGFYLRTLLVEFQKSLGSSQFVNIHDLTIMQILASVIMQNGTSRVKNITNTYLPNLTAEEIEEVWDDISKSIVETIKFLQERLHLIGPNLIPYVYMYPPLVNYFFKAKEHDFDAVKKWFWYTCFSSEELDSTTKVKKAIKELKKLRDGSDIEWNAMTIDRQFFRLETYKARGAKSRAILALMAQQKPCELKDFDRDVLQSVYLQLGDRPNLHHFFPINHIEHHPEQASFKIDRDSLMNIIYLPQIENLAISDENPLTYLKEYIDKNPDFELVLQKHLIPTEVIDWVNDPSITWANYDRFVELRIDLFTNKLRDLLPDIEIREIDSGNIS